MAKNALLDFDIGKRFISVDHSCLISLWTFGWSSFKSFRINLLSLFLFAKKGMEKKNDESSIVCVESEIRPRKVVTTIENVERKSFLSKNYLAMGQVEK